MAEAPQATRQLAGQIAAALAAPDLAAFADLLDPAVRWGPPGDPAPPCQTREQVLSWYRRARDAGARARVTETLVHGDRILVGLKVTGTPADAAGGEQDRWQVLTVRGGRVADIVGFGDRTEAEVWAGIAPAPVLPQPGRWSAPEQPLADELVEVRLPEPPDAEDLHAYAVTPGGLAGTWLPLREGASIAECQWLIADWLNGWRGRLSFHGAALVIVPAGRSRPVGQVGLADCGGRTVELGYGVAPEHRRHGYASRAVRMVARWLLDCHQADQVELRILPDNVASQGVAAAAGFAPAGAVVSHVQGTGQTYQDLRFVQRRS